MGRRINLADLAADDLDVTDDRDRPDRAGAGAATAERAAPAARSRAATRLRSAPAGGSSAGSSVAPSSVAPAGASGVNAVYTPGPDGDTASRMVPIGTVAPNPLNKRPPGDDEELEDLAETIRAHGVIQPLVVCTAAAYRRRFPEQDLGEADWVALIGNRRLRAAGMAGRAEVSIVVNDERVTSMYEVMLVENGQRRDLAPWLEAEAMAEVLAGGEISQRELARRIGRSAMYITHRLALLKLIVPLRAALEAGELSLELAREFGELAVIEQEAIVAGGRPYRRPRPDRGGELTTRSAVRSIRVNSPAVAAASIRKAFTAEELAELVRLLTESVSAAASAPEPTPASTGPAPAASSGGPAAGA